MTIYKKIGLGLIALGIGMFITGVHFFTYRGDVSALMTKIGEFSFTMWLPIIIGGFIFLAFKSKK